MNKLFPIIMFLLFASAGSPRAETLQLLDGTKLIGEIIHFYDGVLTFSTVDGKMRIDRKNIKSIVFKLPDPRAEFSTPEKTFKYWRERMIAGDFDGAVAAYALIFQGQVATQLNEMAVEDKTRMKREIGRTEFEILDVSTSGKKSVLKVKRKLGEKSEEAFLNFVLENSEWKMTP
jgi:hypothetical protein